MTLLYLGLFLCWLATYLGGVWSGICLQRISFNRRLQKWLEKNPHCHTIGRIDEELLGIGEPE